MFLLWVSEHRYASAIIWQRQKETVQRTLNPKPNPSIPEEPGTAWKLAAAEIPGRLGSDLGGGELERRLVVVCARLQFSRAAGLCTATKIRLRDWRTGGGGTEGLGGCDSMVGCMDCATHLNASGV